MQEGYSILFKDGTVVEEPGKSFVGYVYSDKGKIVAVGEGEPPDEYAFATYMIDGRGRILTPGFICPLTSLTQHPSRFGGKEAQTDEELFYAALMGLQDLLLSGFTTVGTIERKVDPVARAIAQSGIRAVIFVDASYEGWKDQLKILLNRWVGYEERIYAGIAALEGNEEAERIAEELNIPIISPNRGIRVKEIEKLSKERGIVVLERAGKRTYGFIGSKTTSPLNVVRALYYTGMKPVDALKAITVDAAEVLGLERVAKLKPGYHADMVVWDVSEPPGWTAGKGEPEEIILSANPKVEAVIAAGEVVVDISQMLTIGAKDVKKARRLFER